MVYDNKNGLEENAKVENNRKGFCTFKMNKNSSLKCISGMLFVALINISSVSADTEYKVRSTDNLNRIVNRFYQGSYLTRSQILIGILAENPDAFNGGNINFLIRGKRLMLPDENNILGVTAEDANKIIAEHDRYFRTGVTGNLKPPFAPGLKSAKDANTQKTNPDEQKIRIEALAKESEALRFRLEKLAADNQDSDKKLRDIDAALQKTLK